MTDPRPETAAEFLTARMGEAWDHAYHAEPGPWTVREHPGASAHGYGVYANPDHAPAALTHYESTAEHIAHHAPDRALRYTDAVYAVLGKLDHAQGQAQRAIYASDRMAARTTADVLGDVVARLAAVYNDHPDYRPEWAPTEETPR